MLRKLIFAIGIVGAYASIAAAQSTTMYIGDIGFRLGMPREAVMRSLSLKYNLIATGETGFIVRQYDQTKKLWNSLGSIGFENNQLTFISRQIDTSGWPNEEGFAVARAIYDAISSSIDKTDSDGAKRADARIVIDNQDAAAGSARGNIRNIAIFLNDRNISIIIWDGTDGRRVSASVAIRTKPW